MFEKTIVDQLESHLASEYGVVFREVPFMHRYIDIIGYDKASGKIVAIEAKIENWSKALKQARTCLLCSDEVYIALPQKYVHRVNCDSLRSMGIGLLSVGEHVETKIKPGPPIYKHKYHFEWLIALLNRLEAAQKGGNLNA
jgi:hypothetical protein